MSRHPPAVPLEKITVHMPEDVLDRLRRAANADSVTVSRMVTTAVLAALDRRPAKGN